MPIIERTPQACFDKFSTHVSKLVAATITPRYPIVPIPTAMRLTISFRERAPIAIPIETQHHGRLFFYLGQALEAVPEDGCFRLVTRQYWYRLQHDAPLETPSVLRWEYDKATERNRYARHHAQFAATLCLGDCTIDLNKAHIPTGWVTFEEVIRFLIHDLGISPPCGDQWPDLLEESERKFFEDYSGK